MVHRFRKQFEWVARAVVGGLALMLSLAPCPGQAQEQFKGHVGLPLDWSTRHILYTNGASPEVAAAAARDPRSWINWVHRSGFRFQPLSGETELPGGPLGWPQPLAAARRMRRDWAISLGPTGGMPVGETPAKYSFNIDGTFSCANDFVVFTIGAAPTATQANIVAFNNLYTGTVSSSCPFGPQTPPTSDFTKATFMWSYAVGTASVVLSPSLSLDGTKVAFVEGSNPPMFDVLTWVSGQGTDATHPAIPGSGGSSVVRVNFTNTATAGCAAGSATDSNSSAYIDYNNDVAYVGADNGKLYRITGVFKGTPTLQYCVTVNAGKLMTSPVFDQVTKQVFVSDGYSVYSFTPGANSFTPGGSIAVASAAAADPIVLSPIVDSTNGFVYVFSLADPANTNSLVAQLNLALTSKATALIGPKAAQFVLDGDFDNAYFTSGPKTGAGTLYACGTQAGGTGNRPSLYALSFQSPTGVMNSTPAMSDNRNINGGTNPVGSCSPLLDFYDGTTDRLFVGTGNFTGSGGANLVTEWNVNARIASNLTPPSATAPAEWGGTSAFTVDNISNTPQAANIYFGTLFTPGSGINPCGAGNFCAVKLTRAGLN